MSVDYSLILAPVEDTYIPSKDMIIKLINYLSTEELTVTVANPFRFNIYKSSDSVKPKPYFVISKMSPEEQINIGETYILGKLLKSCENINELLQELNSLTNKEYIRQRWSIFLRSSDKLRNLLGKDSNFIVWNVTLCIGLQIYHTGQEYKYQYDIKNSCYRDEKGNVVASEIAEKQIVQAIKSFSIEFFSKNHTPYGDETTTYDYYNYHEYLLTFPDVVELKNKISEIIEADTMFTWIYSY